MSYRITKPIWFMAAEPVVDIAVSFVLVLALLAVWDYVAVAVFGAPELTDWQMFWGLWGYKILKGGVSLIGYEIEGK